MNNETGLKPIEVAKVLFQTGAGLCADYEEDEKLGLDEIMKRIQELLTNLWKEYQD